MAVRSVYWPAAVGSVSGTELAVDGDEHRHLLVSRVQENEQVEVLDGCGGVWTGKVLEVRRGSTRIALVDRRTVSHPGTEIILAQALIRRPVFDLVLEKAVELGVNRIVPFRAERSNESGHNRANRWQRIVIEATKQSKQYYVPRVDPVSDLDDVLGIEAASRIALSAENGTNLKAALNGPPAVCVIGPEGGFTESERAQMLNAGYVPVHLGEQILRAETAAIVGIGLLAYELGVL